MEFNNYKKHIYWLIPSIIYLISSFFSITNVDGVRDYLEAYKIAQEGKYTLEDSKYFKTILEVDAGSEIAIKLIDITGGYNINDYKVEINGNYKKFPIASWQNDTDGSFYFFVKITDEIYKILNPGTNNYLRLVYMPNGYKTDKVYFETDK